MPDHHSRRAESLPRIALKFPKRRESKGAMRLVKEGFDPLQTFAVRADTTDEENDAPKTRSLELVIGLGDRE